MDLIAANVGFFINPIEEGLLRPIAVLHPERWSLLPDVPTFEEITGKRNITYAGRTLATANGLEEEKRQIYLDAIKRAMANPEYIAKESQQELLQFAEGERCGSFYARARRSPSRPPTGSRKASSKTHASAFGGMGRMHVRVARPAG